ncbi:unnamed protein product [Amaranthus hypochondriacus]
MEEITDIDMEAARQLVQLSEGDTTTTTATTSSSGSCNSIFCDFNGFNHGDKRRKKLNNNDLGEKNRKKTKDRVIIDEKIISLRCSPSFGSVAGEIDDDNELEVVGSNRRKKIRKYRSIVELYSLTNPIDDESD